MTNKQLMQAFNAQYKRLAWKNHPDRQPPEKREAATRVMQRLNQLRDQTMKAYRESQNEQA